MLIDLANDVNGLRTTTNTLIGTLRHRIGLIEYVLDGVVESSIHQELSTLQTNVLSGLRTSIVGKAMEEVFHRANLEHGNTFLLNIFLAITVHP